MTEYTADMLNKPHVSLNPMTVFAIMAEVGDTFSAVTLTARTLTGPSVNPIAFIRCSFEGYGETWHTDYPNVEVS